MGFLLSTMAFIHQSPYSLRFTRVLPLRGAGIEQPPVDPQTNSNKEESLSPSDAASEPSMMARGKVNEIDFCIAPADVSLSRAYVGQSSLESSSGDSSSPPILSLTRALNNASNRAVRRILLSKSWPSAEALNLSLRRVAAAEKEREMSAKDASAEDSAKCPVPRPILNVLTRKREGQTSPRGRSDEEYVADQLKFFRDRYGELPGYSFAEAYLESVLSLATSGVESVRVSEVMDSGVYDEAYKRVVAILRTVGVTFEKDEQTGRNKIASKLVDQDICLSMLDKLRTRSGPSDDIPETLSHDKKDDSDGSSQEKPKRKFWGKKKDAKGDGGDELTGEDLGGVLLSAKEPSMTGQLNVLSNIVLRALLFGGEQELLVLAETLAADRPAFIDRWYPGKQLNGEKESRPGVQYLDCLITLLRTCYNDGVVTNLNPPLPLSQSYANSYERLVAMAVELGSGYIKPLPSDYISAMPKPRSAQEELGRFAVWESNFRQSQPEFSAYPDDLFGVWEVRDEIAGDVIGTATVVFKDEGIVEVDPPLEGLRWRLDPGPTHLDTCTFQVLSSDGTILQYRGFIDRGARLESRFSKRPIKIRGSVMFQMRDGSVDYYKDMLPINYRTGTTKFVMTKKIDTR